MTRPRSAIAAAVLFAALAAGALLRFQGLGEPSYWLDEILGETLTQSAVAQPWWHWLTGLDREHGPLYYATQLASRAAGRDEFAGRLPAALFGLATIPLVWLVLRKRDAFACGIAALLLATSPLHVYYSREARPYALLMLLTAALLLALLENARPLVVALILVALLYTSATAAPVIAAAAVAMLLVAGSWLLAAFRENPQATSNQQPATSRRLIAITVTATLLVPLLYRGKPWTAATRDFPPLDAKFASVLVHALTVSAFGTDMRGRTAVVLLVFALAGAVTLLRRDRRAATIVTSMTVLPALFAIVPLWHSGHFFATRYIAPSLIGFVILAATGIAALANAGRMRFAGAALALLITFGIVSQTWDTARREPYQKLDWRLIASALRTHVRAGDVIATGESYSYLSLRHYLGALPPDVHFVLLDLVPVGERWIRSAPATWLVTAGYSTEVSRWMCRYPLLLASPLEGFRLHYAPSARAFLLDRSGPPEQRALAAALGTRGVTLDMGTEDDLVLGDGWAGAEGTFRWAVGRHSVVTIPRFGAHDLAIHGRAIRFHSYPLTAPGLPAQTLRISVNDAIVANVTLAPEWRDYAVMAPAARWRDGLNTLTFDFARATSPSSLDPRSGDTRPLAASFDRITIGDAATAPPPAPLRRGGLRLASDSFLDARTVWRNTPTHFPAPRLRRDFAERLLARLGYDPVTTWPQLARGDVSLDNVAETIAYGSDCDDDAAFLHRAFALLLDRQPNADEIEALAGMPRIRIIGKLVKFDELRRRALTPA